MKLKELLQRFHAWQLDPNPLKTKTESRICHGCGKAYEGDYCPVCGQKYDSGQVDWTSLKDELLSIGGLEERTSTASFLLQLFGRPGYMIRDYITGRRYICAEPISMIAVIAMAAALADKIIVNPSTEWISTMAASEGMVGAFFCWLMNNMNWAVLIQTALLILPTMLVFRFSPRLPRHTLPQGVYIQIFMGCMVLICIALRILISDWMLILIPLFYYIAYRQLFGYGIWGTLWRTVLCLGSVMMLFGVEMMVSMHVSKEFWEGVSAFGFIGMIVLHLSLCAGAVFLGWWISKKTKQV